jgi:hypothetical protein
MKIRWIAGLAAISLVGIAAAPLAQSAKTTIEQMPANLETRLALSAAPVGLRDRATVYLLDPRTGYHVTRPGTSGVTCIVQRTAWELADFRNDIYIPLCYDAAGTKSYLNVIMQAAALRAQGMGPDALKAEIEKRYRDGTYRVPEKAGVSYMVAPIQRTVAPPDLKVHTVSMPHVMFYAPNVTNEDIGARPNLAVPASLLHPFIDRQGNPEQSYVIQMLGEAEQARILADEQALVRELCAYRDILCLTNKTH